MYKLSEAPEGYTWEVEESDDPMFPEGKTLELILFKEGKAVERRGIMLHEERRNEADQFLRAMENSIRTSLK